MLLTSIGEIVLGLVILSFGADWLVRASVKISGLLSIPTVIIGLTIVSFGTSAPELAVSAISALSNQSDLAIGNVLGSNIFNILVIIGLSAAIRPMQVHLNLIRIDTPILVALSFLLFLICWGLEISRFAGFILVGLLAAYILLQLFLVKREKKSAKIDEELQEIVKETQIKGDKTKAFLMYSGLFLVGLGLLILGSRWFVSGSVDLARWLGWSELIIGLTLVAVGTSIPEIAASVAAALRGHHDIAIANAIGSNVFNILCVLGITSIIQPLSVAPEALVFDFPVMISVALICWPIFLQGRKVERYEGFLLLLFYLGYMSLLYLRAIGTIELSTYTDTLLYWIIPLASILFVSLIFHLIRKKSAA
ncbi:MAG: calcium/sodium antiporter [Bdellovibrionota bacterium]|jgi:cation:H+ antiporter